MASPGSESSGWTHGLTAYLVYLILVTTTGPLQFGFHLAELNAPEDVITCRKSSISSEDTSTLPQCISMTPVQFGLVQAIFTLGGLIGALSAGPASTKYGRLLTMRLTTVFFVIGPAFEALAPSIPVLSFGRFISGLGAGAAIVVVPVYVAGISPPEKRGLFGASTQVMINLGILITQVLGYFLSHGPYWRIILGVAGAIGVTQFVGLLGAAESPQWSADHGNVQGAKQTLQRIRGPDENIDAETEGWGHSGSEEEEALLHDDPNQPQHQPTKPSHNASVGVFQVLRDPLYRPAIIAVVSVMVAQQFCGINSIVMYGVALLSDLLGAASALLAVFVSLVNLLTTILCAPLSDRYGRKTCLLLSIGGMGANSLLLALSIIFSVPALSIVATVLFVASFAVGLGPVPFILASELVGQEAVGATQSWALAANWIATFVVAQFFPVLNDWMGKGRIFFLFTALACAFGAFVAWWVPESRGKRDADEVWGRERRVD
ncbi:MAG: hypothetical protein M1833_003859 [Piccolia ochrophora]|nr:MAG: hypothetical protein M1833_003859 [Piccolia ochrophora]